MSKRVTAGLVSMIDILKYTANAVARDRETIRREIRRIRIKKWYKDNIGWGYSDGLFGEDEADVSEIWLLLYVVHLGMNLAMAVRRRMI